MAALTQAQRRFLESQAIPESAIFDASGMSPRHYRPRMEREEKLFAIGVSPCSRGNHTIRSRAGHCIQCNTANIAFIMRFYREAYVYIAGSADKRLVKIGCSQAPWDRQSIINKLGYGGIVDWKMLYYARVPDAGKIEFNTHRRLSLFASPRMYVREYNEVECREIFSCGYPQARQAMDSPPSDRPLYEWEHPHALTHYDFVGSEREAKEQATEEPPFNPAFLKKVDELELSVRAANCLKNDNITYIGDLVQKTEGEMLRTPNFGRKSVNEIKEVLNQMGLYLGIEVPGWPPENIETLATRFDKL